ncbi:hypothetical protein JTB14_017551 [Gonioctena quinquepunctata]|nr:hypothetical protein JTB14_017551 [Gonioctena quinquepunctata]
MDHFNQIIYVAAMGALEEAEILAQGRRRRHELLVDPLDDLTGNGLVKIYRVTEPLFHGIVNLVEPNIEPPSVSQKLSTTLRFLASGSYQHDIGKHLNHAISQASVSKAIREVTDALNRPEIVNTYVYMPRNNGELRVVRNG